MCRGHLSPDWTLLGQDNQIVYYAMVYNTALTGQEIAETYTFMQSELAERYLLPRTDHLKIWYKFDEGSGQVLTDYSGNGNHGQLGTIAGADTNDPTWEGGGLYFGEDDICLAPYQELTEFTYIIVVEPMSVVSSSTLMGQCNDDWFGPFIIIGDAQDLEFVGNNLWEQYSASGSFGLGQVQMCAITYDGTTISGYMGSSQSMHNNRTPSEVFVPNSNGFFISNIIDSYGDIAANSDNKCVYYVMVYDCALTDQEIAEAYSHIQADLAARGVTLA